jgi:putative oxidoreductase
MYHDASWLGATGRLLIVFFFLVTGLCNLAPERVKDHIDRMAALRTPLPAAAFWFGIALQFTGCALLLADWHPEVGSACLILFTVVATAIFHRFWNKKDPAQRNASRITLLGNLAVVGGLLLLLDRGL